MNAHVYGVILAGGSGTRFWPLSRERFPKQFLRILGEGTLLQQTFERLLQKIPANRMAIVTNAVQAESIKLQLNQWKDDIAGNVILEPEGRNTAPAIALAALQLIHQDPEAVMVVVPADHVVKASKKFMQAVQFASELAVEGHLVTFGIQPTRPETGYGYIQPLKRRKVGTKGDFIGYSVGRFVEKPNLTTARRYLQSGNYFWNSGIFVWKASQILSEIAIHQPALSKLLSGIKRRMGSEEFPSYLRKVYAKVESLSIDNAVMEHSSRSVVVPIDFGWSDVGSWSSLEEVVPLDKDGNVRNGNIIDLGSRNSVLFADRRVVATIGLNNMVVVDTPDATLVCPKERTQDVKAVVNLLKRQGAPEHLEHRTVHRPWGSYTVMEEGKGYKVKRIEVTPGKRLSLQLHHQRSEHWVVIAGTARVTRGEEVYDLQAGMSTGIAREVPHRLENPGRIPLEIIEIQNGPYLGEDDIVRLQDDFGRLRPIG
ncbi:MAG TPA: mannose-1-phosphate guanylyltransferase/mannose-6-phosphate isomerase [Nitrospirales bacterium]|nr:mannose-1-phosphate guanylyltransferase/mannose-6-phosphate isomerase [Nitrospirales bacterium]